MHSQSQQSVSLYDSPLEPADQREALTGGDVPVAVYGLGKMGLPLAAVYAELTGNTVGVDIDESVVETINRGECPVDREPGLPELVADAVADGDFEATSQSVRAAERASVHVVIVPTLVEDTQPDLSNLRAVAEAIGNGLSPGDLVCVESTVPPRTCDEVVRPILEDESGLELGEFGLAFCPERTSSGRALEDIRGAYPKVVGGVDEESTRAAALIYDELSDNDVYAVSDATTAECVKVFEGVYRDVNIALANELGRLADELGVDVREAIETANTQPFCDIHRPGPGVGGHCIPYYPYFLIEGCHTRTPLLRMARQVNDSMPAFTVQKVLEGLHDAGVSTAEATVGVLGIAYRPGVDETRESPGLDVVDLLEELGVDTCAVDPVVGLDEFDLEGVSMAEITDRDLDAVVLVTDHEEFDDLRWRDFDDAVVVDGRDALDPDALSQDVYTIGVADDASADQY